MSQSKMPKKAEKLRDAERSKDAILRAAGDLFAAAGYDGVSLSEIAAGAGLSRGTPSYFFGSKADLYAAVLQRAFEERESATRRACEPLLSWVASEDPGSIRGALTQAVDGYFDFLLGHPAFLKLVLREELAGAARLRSVPRESKAIEEAFEAVRSIAPHRDLKPFDVQEAVLVFVSLTFFPLAQRSTFMASLGRKLEDAGTRQRHVELVVAQLLSLVGIRTR
jgi:TetR/AcrR family transcriptional regulator